MFKRALSISVLMDSFNKALVGACSVIADLRWQLQCCAVSVFMLELCLHHLHGAAAAQSGAQLGRGAVPARGRVRRYCVYTHEEIYLE